MNLAEVIILVIALGGLFLAWQSNKNHATIAAQASADIADLKADIATLKTQFAVHEATSSAPAAAPAAAK